MKKILDFVFNLTIRFLPCSLELGLTKFSLSFLGFAFHNRSMRHLFFFRIDKMGIGFNLAYFYMKAWVSNRLKIDKLGPKPKQINR